MSLPRRSLLLAMLGSGLLTVGTATHAATRGEVRVKDGRELLRDCVPWVPFGLSFFGRLTPKGWPTNEAAVLARNEFGPWTVNAVKWMGGDVLRLEVGLPFVDPGSPQFSASYIEEIKQAVAMARNAGLTVILCMQYQERTNVKPVEYLPGASTQRAWNKLGPVFAGDLGVIYEIFNEPVSKPQPDAVRWKGWQKGHQAVIDDLRAARIRNTVLVAGLYGSHTFLGAPVLQDPTGQIAYALHPYFRETFKNTADWDAAFGNFARDHAVIVTEWGMSREACDVAGESTAEQLLSYLEQRKIGVILYGADEQYSRLLRREGSGFRLTTFKNKSCNAPGAGPGEVIKPFFDRGTRLNATQRPRADAVCSLR